ncbi:MAG: amidohydrolase [Bacteroidales bacterium]
MKLSNDFLDRLIAFRRELHKYPEVSKKEHKTAKKVRDFLEEFEPDELIENLGKTGLAAVFYGEEDGPVVLVRADIDALPIQEVNDFDHKSVFPDVGHKCGHDGHTTILTGLAGIVHRNPVKKGKLVLLYQPAEETGEGAELVLNDPKFEKIKPDYVFALHNLPGFKRGNILVSDRHFAAASKGMIIRLTGKTSHAATPELGVSPALAVAETIQQLTELSQKGEGFEDFKLITIIHTRIGEIAFGTTPGYAEVMATLRSYRNDDMDLLTDKAVKIAEKIADKYNLHEKIEWTEEFPATINNPECTGLIREVAKENDLKIEEIQTPFRWSEDFGHFTMKAPGAYFGIGAGKDHPPVHNPDYDFPDEIIKTGITMFNGIIRKFLG